VQPSDTTKSHQKFHLANGRFAPEAVMPFSFAVTFHFEVMGTRGRLTDYHLSAKISRGGPAETDL
jgi:hypothetical protein